MKCNFSWTQKTVLACTTYADAIKLLKDGWKFHLFRVNFTLKWKSKSDVSVSVKVCLVGGVEKWEDRKWGGDRKVER